MSTEYTLTMKLLSFLFLIILSSSCLKKNSVEKEILPLISRSYKTELENLLISHPELLKSHKLSLIKHTLVIKALESKHPFFNKDSKTNRADVLTKILTKLDPLNILYTAKDISFLTDNAPKEEINLLTPPVIFLSKVKNKTLERLDALIIAKEVFLKSKVNFADERSFYVGENPPRANGEKELLDNWDTYLSAILVQLALENKYSTKEAINNEKILKEDLDKFTTNLISTYKSNLNEPQYLINIYLNVLLNSFDEYSNYISPELSDGFKRNLSLDSLSLGFNFKVDLNNLTVTEVFEPAKAAGLLAGDKINAISIKNKEYSFANINKLLEILSSPPEEEIQFKIQRNKNLSSIKITPKMMTNENKAVQYFMFKDKDSLLGYIKIPQFYYGATLEDNRLEQKLFDIILKFDSLGVKGIILDLQNNGGGSFPAAFQVLSLFLPNGAVLQEKTIDQTIVHKIEPHDLTYNGKVVVLVNKLSASSAEILANGLKERGRAIIVGTSTFGKGTIQEVISLSSIIKSYPDLKDYASDVGHLKITRSSFHKLDGQPLHGRGVTPDIEIVSPLIYSKKLKPLDILALSPISTPISSISQIPELKIQSEIRQSKEDVFKIIKNLNEEEKLLLLHEDWMFTNLNTMSELIQSREVLDKKKKNIKSSSSLILVEEESNTSSLYDSLKNDPVVQEAINILKDYVVH